MRIAFTLLLFLFASSYQLLLGQSAITFDKNISLPEISHLGNTDYASGAFDIITANNYVYVYTSDKIIVLDATGQSIITTIPFNEKYGKFNPLFENSRKYIAEVNFMTIFKNELANNREDLYVVAPNLDILLINTNLNTITNTFDVSADITNLKPLHGVCIIKYDDVHNRLYRLIKGRQVDPDPIYNQNNIGQFHYREVYFAIYDVQTNGNINTTPFYNFHELTENEAPSTAHYRNINICDFEFNRNSITGENDYFYLAKYNKIEVWQISNDQTVNIRHLIPVDDAIYGVDSYGNPNYYKFSKLQYINDEDIHKVVALPYRYPSKVLIDPENHPPLIYVIDCDNTNVETNIFIANSVETINSPNQSVYDAVYMPETKDLVISFSANPDEQLEPIDLAVYDFNPNSPTWINSTPISSFLTSPNPVPDKDINTPTNLLKINNAVLVNKKDEIIKLYPSGATYNVTPNIMAGTGSENNFFRKGVANQNNSFVLNTAAGKIETFDLQGGSHSSLTLASIAHHIVPNTTGSKQYIYNKLNIENTGFYIYNSITETSININEDIYPANDFTSIIGDIVYNEYTSPGEFLVTKNANFGENPATTLYRYTDNQYNSLAGEISLEDLSNGLKFQNAKEMFIDPNGILYVMVNTAVGDITNPNSPYLLIYNANTYEFINSHELTLPTINNNAEFYMSHFCYSKSNNTVYLAVTPQEVSLVPYQAEFNSMINPNMDPPNYGSFYSINSNHELTVEKTSIVSPGKIICPDDRDDTHLSDFESKVYILSNQLYRFNINNKSIETTSRMLNDIIYSPIHDRLFGFADELVTGLDDRKAVVYEITIEEMTYVFTPLFDYPGQITSFFISPYNDKLYLHTKFDKYKLGDKSSQLVSFNLLTNVTETIDLQDNNTNSQNRSIYPEFDHCPDYHIYNYNLTTPFFNTETNKIYLPNGAHSNISVVNVTDQLLLDGELNWISIPRHVRNTAPDYTPTLDVFDDDNFVSGYNSLTLNHLFVSQNSSQPYMVTSNGITWSYDPNYLDNQRTYSTRGYKLTLDEYHQNNILELAGKLENPSTPINLYEAKENWVGYFLYKEQDIFDALGEVANYSLEIRAQNWFCYYDGPFRNPGTPVQGTIGWVCSEDVHNIKYGEMVVVTTDWGVPENYTFTWQGDGVRIDEAPKDEASFFTFTETADYTPITILLDTTDNMDEIGAFVNDSCVGACVVLPEDTLVGIQAYMEGQPGDSIVFQTWASTKSTAKATINNYNVYNNEAKRFEPGIIVTGSSSDLYKVSFRKQSNDEFHHINTITSFKIYPNPASQNLNLEYVLGSNCEVVVEVYDIYGRLVSTINKGTQMQGAQKIIWNLTGNNGQRLCTGIYTVRLLAGSETVTKKVVIN